MRLPLRIIVPMFLMALTSIIYCEEVAVAVVESATWWHPLFAAAGAAIIAWITKIANDFVKTKRAEISVAKEEDDNYFLNELIADTVQTLNSKHLPSIAQAIADGKLTKDEAKTELKILGETAIAIVVEDAGAKGIEIAADKGLGWIQRRIRGYVDKYSPTHGATVDALFAKYHDKAEGMLTSQGEKLLATVAEKISEKID